MSPKCILSIYDATGNWPLPYEEAGHQVILVDTKHFIDAMELDCEMIMSEFMDNSCTGTIAAILAAPPCTHFTVSGAQYWKKKDIDGRTAAGLELVRQVFRAREFCKPDFWALENPVGRLNTLLPEMKGFGPWYFQPHWFGDAYTKKTGLWGEFCRDLPRNEVEPVRACAQGSWLQKLGGKSEKTKALRSATPMGFARAFYAANNWEKPGKRAGWPTWDYEEDDG